MRACPSIILAIAIGISGPGFAASIIDDDTFARKIGSYSVGESSRMIEACDSTSGAKVCIVYPSPQALGYGFKGTTKDWEALFNRCMQFELNNVATDVTMGISSLALFSQLSVLKAILAGTATGLGTSAVLGRPYPAIPSQEVAAAMQFFDYVLSAKEEQIFAPVEVVGSLKTILDTCSWRFSEWTKEREHGRCMRGCHGG